MSNFCFGIDPEFILIEKSNFKSAIGVLPSKEKALEKNGNKYYFDNVLAEIAVKPAKSKKEALKNVQKALEGLAKLIDPIRFTIKASGNYPEEELNCEEARIASCNPEWNVYSLEQILPPDEDVDLLDGYYQFKTPFRSAGGHIHIGSDQLEDALETFNVIRMMDLFIGVPSILMDNDPSSKDRRKIYGHAGSHRIPEYGLEYRSLSNFWLSSPNHVDLIYDLTDFTLDFVKQKNQDQLWTVDEEILDGEEPSLAYDCFGYDPENLCETINTCNKEEAEKFMVLISKYIPKNLLQKINTLSKEGVSDPYIAWDIK